MSTKKIKIDKNDSSISSRIKNNQNRIVTTASLQKEGKDAVKFNKKKIADLDEKIKQNQPADTNLSERYVADIKLLEILSNMLLDIQNVINQKRLDSLNKKNDNDYKTQEDLQEQIDQLKADAKELYGEQKNLTESKDAYAKFKEDYAKLELAKLTLEDPEAPEKNKIFAQKFVTSLEAKLDKTAQKISIPGAKPNDPPHTFRNKEELTQFLDQGYEIGSDKLYRTSLVKLANNFTAVKDCINEEKSRSDNPFNVEATSSFHYEDLLNNSADSLKDNISNIQEVNPAFRDFAQSKQREMDELKKRNEPSSEQKLG